MYTNRKVLTFDDDRHTDEDQEGDTDSGEMMPSAVHRMPHVEMVAPVETAEEKIQKEEPEIQSKWHKSFFCCCNVHVLCIVYFVNSAKLLAFYDRV